MKRKGFLLASAAGVAFAPGAHAADLPVKAPGYAPSVAPAGSWAGWYIGAHAGAAWQQAHNANTYSESGSSQTSSFGSLSNSGTGFIGGGQIGYNWQHGNFVLGLEADGSWLTGKADNTAAGDSSGNSYGARSGFAGASNQIRWLSTVRGRFGLAVGDTMVYGTGGVAFGGVRNSIALASDFGQVSESKTRVGWAIGGGVEHMWTPNWTIGLEALFVDLGRSTATAVIFSNQNGTGTKTTKFSNQAVIGRVKLNYKW